MLYEYINLQLLAEESAAVPGTDMAGDTPPDAGEEQDFDELIRGRYKAQFDQRLRKILDGRLRSLRKENESLRAQTLRQQETARSAFAALERRQEEVRSVYPEFDWQQEVRDPAFARLIAAGVEPRTAYEVTHSRELMARAMAYAARQSAQHAARTVAAGQRRVAENGRRAPAVTRTDPRQLTGQELADIRQRVLGGEKIRF